MRCRVRAIIYRDNKLLLVRHKNSDGQPYDTWSLPGGGVEEGEMIIDAMRREMIEETGIIPVVGKLLFVHQFYRNDRYEGPEFFFEIENTEEYTDIDLAKTSHGHAEIYEIGFYDPAMVINLLPEFLKDLHVTDLQTPKLIIQGPEQ